MTLPVPTEQGATSIKKIATPGVITRSVKEQLLKEGKLSPVMDASSAKRWLENKNYTVHGEQYSMLVLCMALLRISQVAKIDKEVYDGMWAVACIIEEAAVSEMSILVANACEERLLVMVEAQSQQKGEEATKLLEEIRQATETFQAQVDEL
jgi:hypothetical protein